MSTSSVPGLVTVRELADGNVYEVIAADLKAPLRAASRKAPNACASPCTNKANIHQLLGLSKGLTGKVTPLQMWAAELAIRQGTECISVVNKCPKVYDSERRRFCRIGDQADHLTMLSVLTEMA